MSSTASASRSAPPGQQLLEDVRLPASHVDALFVLLLLTMASVFVLGNVVARDAAALRASFGVTVAAAGFALVCHAVARRTGSVAAGLACGCLLLLGATLARSPAVDALCYAVAAAAAIDAARHLRVSSWTGGLAVAAVAAVVILGSPYGYTSFDIASRLAAGRVHQDPLYHAAIAAMIKNYGVVSTGLHGLVETPYHALSHALVAGVSRLSGVPVLEVYGTAKWVLFAPLVLLSMSALALVLGAGAASAALVWGLAAALMGAASLLQPWAFLSTFGSESYLLALALVLPALALPLRRRLTAWDLAGAVLLTLLVSQAKISVGVVYAGLWLVRALFLREGRLLAAVTAAAALATAAWAVFGPASTARLVIEPLHFLRRYTLYGDSLAAVRMGIELDMPVPLPTLLAAAVAVGGFVFMHFLPCWFVVALAVRDTGARRVLQSPLPLYVLAATGVALLVVGLLAIPGGSAYYFSSLPFFIAVPVLLARGAAWLAQRDFAPRAWHGFAALAAAPVLLQAAEPVGASWPPAPPSTLPAKLAALRDTGPRNVVLRPDPADLAANPVAQCTARPFVFPAVSERPWTGVIAPFPHRQCAYVYYHYDQYRLTGELQQVGRPVVLAPGMVVQPLRQALGAP